MLSVSEQSRDSSGPLEHVRAATPESWALATGTALGLFVGGPDGAIAGAAAAPYLLAFIQIAGDARRQRIGSAEHLLAVTGDDLGKSPDELREIVVSDPRLLELAARVIEAAGRTTMEDKLQALSRVLANGLRDDAAIDEAVFVADALSAMEPPHVLVLRTIDRSLPEPASGEPGWSTHWLLLEYPMYEKVLASVLRALERHGLITDLALGTWGAAEGHAYYAVTGLGTSVLELLSSPIA
jgi:hypothetical protein